MLAICWQKIFMNPMICISSSHMLLKCSSHMNSIQASEMLFSSQLGHAYSNIFSLRLGRDKVVFITGYKLVKEALVTQAENFVDRPYSPVLSRVYSGNGRSNGYDLSKEFRRKHCLLWIWRSKPPLLTKDKHSFKLWNSSSYFIWICYLFLK